MFASTSTETHFAPAARLPLAEVKRQASILRDFPLLDPAFNALPIAVMVLNEQRQIVYANQQFASFLPPEQEPPIMGWRPGEVLACVHAHDMEAGCGTSDFCRACGALAVVLKAQGGQDATGESRMTVLRQGKPVAIDLRLWARPFTFGGHPFCLVSALDISDEKRRLLLERIFFHDIANTAAVISGYADLMSSPERSEAKELAQMASYMAEAGHQLVDEIVGQRQLLAAERGDLPVEPQMVETAALLANVVNLYRRHPLAEVRQLQLDLNTFNQVIWTDGTLLGRIISNMVKNALEATGPGEIITLGCDKTDGGVRFWVHNPGYIAAPIQRQIFQRSFSTKGKNRGLGTYGMKLLSEGYLQGRVSFNSSPTLGTTFYAAFPQEWAETSVEIGGDN